MTSRAGQDVKLNLGLIKLILLTLESCIQYASRPCLAFRPKTATSLCLAMRGASALAPPPTRLREVRS